MSKWRRGLTHAVLIVLVAVAGFQTVIAQDAPQSGSGLIITPPRKELEISPGNSEVIKVTLTNVSGSDITAKAEINDFESNNQTGEPKIIADQNRESATSVKNFLAGVADVELKKDEKKEFDVTVNVPANTPAGAYYGIVRYSAIPKQQPGDEGAGRVSLTASVGMLVLLEVPGDIREQIQVQSVKVQHQNKAGGFFLKSPNQVAIEIKNNGNGFARPFGRVAVTNGSKEVYSYELNDVEPRNNILPGSTRVFTDKLENVKTPGRYTVTANVAHGRGGEVLTHRATFWYLPPWLLAIAAALLALIVGTATVMYRRRFGKRAAANRRRR